MAALEPRGEKGKRQAGEGLGRERRKRELDRVLGRPDTQGLAASEGSSYSLDIPAAEDFKMAGRDDGHQGCGNCNHQGQGRGRWRGCSERAPARITGRYDADMRSVVLKMLRSGSGLALYDRWSARRRSACPNCGFPGYRWAEERDSLLREIAAGRDPFECSFTRPLLECFASAEFAFLRDFCPQRSHEERLTGHLVSEIRAAAYVASEEVRRVSRLQYGSDLEVRFAYRDLSARWQEGTTGADLGLAVEVDLPDRPRSLSVCVFQAKSMRSAERPLDDKEVEQHEHLKKWAGDAAHYLFYDIAGEVGFPPLVAEARHMEGKAVPAAGRPAAGVPGLEGVHWLVPLSVFLIFRQAGLESNRSSAGRMFKHWWDAKRFLGGGERHPEGAPGVAHLARLTIGAAPRLEGEGAWPDLPTDNPE